MGRKHIQSVGSVIYWFSVILGVTVLVGNVDLVTDVDQAAYFKNYLSVVSN